MKRFVSLAALFVALAVMVTSTHAAESKSQSPEGMKNSHQAMSPDQMAKMEQMKKLSAPNENHKVLDGFVGRWNHQVSFWQTPDAPPEQSKGTSVVKWIMDGRFLQHDAKGVSMGQPFQGMGITGYDNIKKEYTTLWLDNMATGIMAGSATYDPTQKLFSEKGTFSCPMTGEKDKPFRAQIKWSDKDHYFYEFFTAAPNGGKEYRMMEIQYSRVTNPSPKVSQNTKK